MVLTTWVLREIETCSYTSNNKNHLIFNGLNLYRAFLLAECFASDFNSTKMINHQVSRNGFFQIHNFGHEVSVVTDRHPFEAKD